VRDKIPKIIEGKGEKCNYTVLEKEEYIQQLRKKLKEEVNEYLYLFLDNQYEYKVNLSLFHYR